MPLTDTRTNYNDVCANDADEEYFRLPTNTRERHVPRIPSVSSKSCSTEPFITDKFMTLTNVIYAESRMIVKAAHLIAPTTQEPLPISNPIMVTASIHPSTLTRQPQETNYPKPELHRDQGTTTALPVELVASMIPILVTPSTHSVAFQPQPSTVNTVLSITARSSSLMNVSSGRRSPHSTGPLIFATIVFDTVAATSNCTTSRKSIAARSASTSKLSVTCKPCRCHFHPRIPFHVP